MKRSCRCAGMLLFVWLVAAGSLRGGEIQILPQAADVNVFALTFDCATDAYYQILTAGALKSNEWAVTNMGLGSPSPVSWTGNFPQANLYFRVRSVPQSSPRDEDGDGMPDHWECQYGLNPFDDDSREDFDQDGFDNLEEYRATPRTDPTNSFSVPFGVIYVSTSGSAKADGTYTNPFPSIATGIAQATNGMRVLLFPGIYTGAANKNLDFGGKSIGVKGLAGASHTIIDCEGAGRGFYFHSGETRNAVVEGITIRNGVSTEGHGGGILCEGSSPTIRHCLISSNNASGADTIGGGIGCVNNASPLITDCFVVSSYARYGGGIGCDYSTPLITNCTVAYNSAKGGGGIGCKNYASPLITDCAIANNSTSESGEGGGIFCDGSKPRVENCLICDNDDSDDGGGGVMCNNTGAGLTFKNCIIQRNLGYNGGGFHVKAGAAATVVNCTILNNGYFGLVGKENNDLKVVNCILWDNWSSIQYMPDFNGNDVEQYIVGEQIFGSATVSYSDIQNGWSGPGDHNVNGNPILGFDGRLSSRNSPCVGTGTSVGAPSKDIDGDARPFPVGGWVDMGADEFFDSDGDGMSDRWERRNGLNPNHPADALLDPDADGLNNLGEFESGADRMNPDSDDDGLSDGVEVLTYHTNPLASDSDGDEMPDKWEADHLTNPRVNDTRDDLDGDGYLTLYEFLHGSDPHDVNSIPVPDIVVNVAAGQTIQQALDSAEMYDIVAVSDGVYKGPGNRDIVVPDQHVMVTSIHGPLSCVLDCEGQGWDSCRARDTVISGFTIRHGSTAVWAAGMGREYTTCPILSKTV